MQQKLDYIVFLRCLATLAVLMNHTALVALGTYKNPSLADGVIVHTIVNFVHFAVPVFVMITGALLLDTQRSISFDKAIRKYVWRMVVILFTIGFAFALMEEYFVSRVFSISLITNSFKNVVYGYSWEHMWYIYMLIGLYLSIPFIKVAINNLDLKQIDYFLLILFCFSSILPIVERLYGLHIGVSFPITSVYVLYLILGWRVTQSNIRLPFISNSRALLAAFVTISILIGGGNAYMEYMYDNQTYNCLTSYTSPFEVILGFLIFCYAYSKQGKWGKLVKTSIIKIIDKNSFGIYLFHMLWINIIYKMFSFNPLDYNKFVYIIFVIIILALSVITSEIYRKIPFIGKYI